MNIIIKPDTLASKQQIIEAANASARQLRYEKLKDLQLEIVIGIVSGQDVFATFPGALAVFDACIMLDSSFHTEITLLQSSDGPRESPSRLLFSFTQVPHAQHSCRTDLVYVCPRTLPPLSEGAAPPD